MSKARILIVEDEWIVSVDLQTNLENDGYSIVAIASSGEEGIALAKKYRPDLVIMDIVLEGKLDGVETAEIILTELEIPVVYSTAYADDKTVQRLKKTQPLGYVLKPFDENEIKGVVETAIYRHNIEKKLRESERKYRTLYETMLNGVLYIDLTGRILSMNPAAEKILGFSIGPRVKAAQNITNWKLVHDDGTPYTPKDIPVIVAGKSGKKYSNLVMGVTPTRNSKQIWINMNIVPQFDPISKNPNYIYATFEDITERKLAELEKLKAEDELQKSEEKYRSLLESIRDGVFSLDVEGNFTFVNDIILKRSGKTEKWFLGKHFTKMIKSVDIPRVTDYFKSSMRHEASSILELEYPTPIAHGIWVEIHTTPLHKDGQIVGLLGVARDISERKRVESILQEYKQAVESSEDMIVVVDEKFRIHLANDSFNTFINRSRTDVVGYNLARFIRRKAVYDEISRKLNLCFDGQSVQHEVTFSNGKNNHRFFQVSYFPMTKNNGNLAKSVMLLRDITEQKIAQLTTQNAKDELHYRSGQLDRLRKAGLALSSQLDPDALNQFIVHEAMELLNGCGASLSLYKSDSNDLETIAHKNTKISLKPVHKKGIGPHGKIWKTGDAIIQNRLKYSESPDSRKTFAIVGVPLTIGKEFIGALIVEAEFPRKFTEEDIGYLELLATQAAITIRNARLYQSESKRAKQLSVVSNISGKAVSILDSNLLFEEIVKDIQNQFGYHNVNLLKYNPIERVLGPQAVAGGYKSISYYDYRQPLGRGLIGIAASQGKSVMVNDVSKDPRYLVGYDEKVPTQSEMAVPLKIGKEILGVLDIQETQTNAFDETDEQTVEILADQIAIAMKNASLYEELQQELHDKMIAELALRESEKRYRALVESSEDIIFQVDKKSRFLFLNKSGCRQFNAPLEQIIGKKLRAVIRGKTSEKPTEMLEAVIQTKQPISEEHQLRANGTHNDFSTVLVPLLDREGRLESVIGISRNITKRIQTENALKESERRFRLLFERAPLGYQSLDETGRILDVNEAWLETFGYNVENVIGKDFFTFISSEFRKDFKKKFMKFKTVDQIDSFELEIKKADGSTIIVTLNGKVGFEKNSKVKQMHCILNDITHQRAAEIALKESEAKYRSLYSMVRLMCDNVPDLIWAKSLNGKYIFANKAICNKLLNARDTDEPIGMTDLFFADRERNSHADNPKYHTFGEICQDSDSIVIRNRKSQRFDEFGNVKNKFLFLDVYKAPFWDENGEMIGTVGCGRDVTHEKRLEEDRKAVEKELIKSREILRNLFANLQSVREEERTRISREIHDELGQALTALKMDLYWLDGKLSDDDHGYKQKLESMIELLNFTIQCVKKISSDLRPGLLDDLGLTAAIEWQADEFQKHSGINVCIDEIPEEVNIDPEKATAIFRIFQETLTNVARHAKASEIKISMKTDDKKVRLKVSDNGIGIPKGKITDAKSLGLIGMHERVHPFNGRVRIQGIKNKGTTLTMTIPL